MNFARFTINTLMTAFARVEAQGMENVPASGAYVTASNHLGRLDAALVYYLLDRDDITMLVAEKYRNYAIYRWFVKRLNAIWVDRYNADLGAMRASLERLRQGQVLVMAPEGTRSPTGALIEAHSGGTYLAAKAGVPILPVAVTGTEDRSVVAQLKHLKRAHVIVRIGKPFLLPPIKGKDREAILKQYTDEIMCQIAVLLPASYRGVYADHPRLQELMSV
jgi:1-acyl-sn-glycerol-3-phosphate acyltransferase